MEDKGITGFTLHKESWSQKEFVSTEREKLQETMDQMGKKGTRRAGSLGSH